MEKTLKRERRTKKPSFIFALLLFSGLVLTTRAERKFANRSDATVQFVSIIELISNPAKFSGHPVRIIGFLRLEFEGNAIYLSTDDCDHQVTKNGLWVTFKSGFNNDLSNKYVLIEGVFNADNKGHLGLWSGAVENINRAEPWPHVR